jgi:hypothetical protein
MLCSVHSLDITLVQLYRKPQLVLGILQCDGACPLLCHHSHVYEASPQLRA